MNTSTEAVGRLILERITVTGKGWLDGLDVPFASKLTSILGGKGTGKTTLLLFLGYVLEVPLGQKELSTVRNNLGAGRIELWVTVAGGTRYVLARSWNGRSAVYNDRHEPVKMTVAGNDLFAVDFYSHDQLGSIADKPEEQLALLDRVAGMPMRKLAEEYATARKALLDGQAQIITMHAERTRLENLAVEAGEIGRELEAMAPKEGPLKEEADRAHAARILRDREQGSFDAARAGIETLRELLRGLESSARQKLGGALEQDLLVGPNGAILRVLEEARGLEDRGRGAFALSARSLRRSRLLVARRVRRR